MYDELTEVDIRKMQEEIDYRVRELRPQLIEEVQTARAFGDLRRCPFFSAQLTSVRPAALV